MFFDFLDESVASVPDLDDSDEFKQNILRELAANHQRVDKFKLKLGHKNLIINLCFELQNVNIEQFNGNIVQLPETQRVQPDLVVRKQQEEHGYSIDNEKTKKASSALRSPQQSQEVPSSEHQDEMQFMLEDDVDEEEQHFMEQEYLDENETYDEETEVIEYQEIHPDEICDDSDIYTAEQIIKNEADSFENSQNCFEIQSGYDSSSSLNRSGPKNKKPKHMYTEEFLQTQMTHGRIGTPG